MVGESSEEERGRQICAVVNSSVKGGKAFCPQAVSLTVYFCVDTDNIDSVKAQYHPYYIQVRQKSVQWDRGWTKI